MNCATCHDHLIDYLYGELDDTQRRAFEDALERCPECAEELVALKQLLASADHAPQLELSSEQRATVLAAAKEAAAANRAPTVIPIFRRAGFQTAIAAIFAMGIASWVFLRSDNVLERATQFPPPAGEQYQVAQDSPREEAAVIGSPELAAAPTRGSADEQSADRAVSAEIAASADEAEAPLAVANARMRSAPEQRSNVQAEDIAAAENIAAAEQVDRTGTYASRAQQQASPPSRVTGSGSAGRPSDGNDSGAAAGLGEFGSVASARTSPAAAPATPAQAPTPSTRSDNQAAVARATAESAAAKPAAPHSMELARVDAAPMGEKSKAEPSRAGSAPAIAAATEPPSGSGNADALADTAALQEQAEMEDLPEEATGPEAIEDAKQAWEANDYDEAYERFVEIERKHRTTFYRDAQALYRAADAAQRASKSAAKLRWAKRYLEIAPDGPHADEVRRWVPADQLPTDSEPAADIEAPSGD